MNRFNLWRYDSKATGSTGGWVLVGVVSAPTEALALSGAAQKLKVKKMWLRVYPHIDNVAVAS